MKRITGLLVLAAALSVAAADEPPITGITRSGNFADIIRRMVLKSTLELDKCAGVAEIRVSNMPTNAGPATDEHGGPDELWTAIGCGSEYSYRVRWGHASTGGGGVAIAPYPWHVASPNYRLERP